MSEMVAKPHEMAEFAGVKKRKARSPVLAYAAQNSQ
jgi:hypothetical protein